MESYIQWEDLTIYKPLKKEDLKHSYKRFTDIIFHNLSHFGFKRYGRMLIKQSNELLHVIHLDTRGSWTGMSDRFNVEIAITTIYDEDSFIHNRGLTGAKKIEQIIPGLRNFYRITQEYELLADFLTRKIIEFVLPYFDKYNSAAQILANPKDFDLRQITALHQRNGNLFLFCELHNHCDEYALAILKERVEHHILSGADQTNPIFTELKTLFELVKQKNWLAVTNALNKKQVIVLKKLRLKALPNKASTPD
ncbi:hypothetical protein SAMN05421821_10913 [Mucilaginibacter lappiensis]|uniref:Uncharacterized protein n=1 Tax=Mucilaginibacter lappiensis TaxID=354630 RepID=A0ABR6PRR6_9SPHI|nr:hypothetical protein [Mucilaginibacter lappiensis]MBB6110971.1 hypothetical protein [Mucilaginibacter lappiensis]SIR59238.1 hypothetical protein SAMN05421821_10913 [Mucilaginibacter lappiensis]